MCVNQTHLEHQFAGVQIARELAQRPAVDELKVIEIAVYVYIYLYASIDAFRVCHCALVHNLTRARESNIQAVRQRRYSD